MYNLLLLARLEASYNRVTQSTVSRSLLSRVVFALNNFAAYRWQLYDMTVCRVGRPIAVGLILVRIRGAICLAQWKVGIATTLLEGSQLAAIVCENVTAEIAARVATRHSNIEPHCNPRPIRSEGSAGKHRHSMVDIR